MPTPYLRVCALSVGADSVQCWCPPCWRPALSRAAPRHRVKPRRKRQPAKFKTPVTERMRLLTITSKPSLSSMVSTMTSLPSSSRKRNCRRSSMSFAVRLSAWQLARYVESGTEGIPLLTDVTEPQDQIQAEVFADIMTNTGADVLDQYEAAEKELQETRDDVTDRQQKVEAQQEEFARLEEVALDEVARLREIEQERLQDEAVQKALEARIAAERAALDEQQRLEAEAAARARAESRPHGAIDDRTLGVHRHRRCPNYDRLRRKCCRSSRNHNSRDPCAGDNSSRNQRRIRRNQWRPDRRWRRREQSRRRQRKRRCQHNLGLRRQHHLPDARIRLRRYLGRPTLRWTPPRGRRHDRSSRLTDLRCCQRRGDVQSQPAGWQRRLLSGGQRQQVLLRAHGQLRGGEPSCRSGRNDCVQRRHRQRQVLDAAPTLPSASWRRASGQPVSHGTSRRLLICEARRR